MAADPVVLYVEQLRRRVPGGIGTTVRGLLRGLAAEPAGQRPPIVAYASAGRRDLGVGLGSDPIELRTGMLPGRAATRLWSVGLGGPRGRFAVAHATSFAFPPVAAPLVATVHDLAWRHLPEAYTARGRRWHEAALRRVGARAAGFVVPSAAVADDLLASGLDLGERPVEVIPWGADHLDAPDPLSCAALLARLGVDGPFLLTVSTIEPRKNLARLVEAFGVARPALGGHPQLVVVGPAGWGEAPTGADGVVFAGAVSSATLAALYGAARAVAYVPLLEGFGLPVVEAMAAGAPIVASPVPAATDGVVLIDPRDPRSIADGIVTVWTDGTLRDELRRVGTAVAARHSWQSVAQRHLEVWNRLGRS
jgi:glycosyltransferase involved in cell wall biosynthesis